MDSSLWKGLPKPEKVYQNSAKSSHPSPQWGSILVPICYNNHSAVLVQEDSGMHKPVFFITRSLHDAKNRYQPLEKLTLALIFVAWKLQPYFQSHPIHILTNSPLRQVLLKLEVSRRLMKWAIEFSKLDIKYHPRKKNQRTSLSWLSNRNSW